jgi:hypothetical protein
MPSVAPPSASALAASDELAADPATDTLSKKQQKKDARKAEKAEKAAQRQQQQQAVDAEDPFAPPLRLCTRRGDPVQGFIIVFIPTRVALSILLVFCYCYLF